MTIGRYTGLLPTDFLGNKTFRVSARYGFVRPNGDAIPVPTGFETDFASIPRWAQVVYPLIGPWIPGAVIHDLLCAAELVPIPLGCQIFKEALLASGVSQIDAQIMYLATMIGTWTTYRKHTPSQIRSIRSRLGIRSMVRPLWRTRTEFTGDELK